MSDQLDNNLYPVNSPIAQNAQGAVTPYDFGNENERNSVGNFNLRNFTFSKGTGGTLTLGGTSNGNGYFEIKNDAGSVIVEADNTGLTINNGSIIIKNAGGTTSMDASGVVSSSNFQGVSLYAAPGTETTSTSFVDIANSSLTPLVLTRTTRVLIFCDAYGLNSTFINGSNNYGVEIQVYDLSGSVGMINNFLYGIPNTHIDWDTGSGLINSVSYVLTAQSTYRQNIFSLTAGTYTFDLQFRALNGGTAVISDYELGYIVLGT